MPTAFSQILLSSPRHIAFGAASILNCVEVLTRHEVHRVFVVSSPRALKAAKTFFEFLNNQALEVEYFTDIHSETNVAHLDAALEKVRKFKPDAVIGLGGGSVLDLAKLVAALHDSTQTLDEALGINNLQSRRTLLICVPTTAGTGSEVSPNALLLDHNHSKKAVISPWLVPDAAFIDPELMVGVPADITAYTGIDALTHCIEAFANNFAHPTTDLYALKGAELIAQNLPLVVREDENIEARAQVALGSLYGGLCLGPVNTAAVHALAYGLSSELGLGHGLSNALLLVSVLRFNLPAAPKRYAALALSLGAQAGRDDLETAQRGIEFLAQLCIECGIERSRFTFPNLDEAIPKMAEEAIKVQRLLKNNPREVTYDDAVCIFQNALQGTENLLPCPKNIAVF